MAFFTRGQVSGYHSRMSLTPKIEKFVEAHHRVLDLANSAGWWAWDLDDRDCEYMSPGFWRTLGVDPETKRHSPDEWLALIHPEDGALAWSNFQAHLESGGRHPYVQTVRYMHASGHWVHVRCSGQADIDTNIMVGCHTDVTEHVAATAKVREISRRLDEQSTRLDTILGEL